MNECVISARHRLAHINYILTANSIKVNDVNVCKHVRCVANSRRYIVFNLYCITVISIWRVCEYGTIERHSRIFAHPLQVGVVYLNTCVPKYHICSTVRLFKCLRSIKNRHELIGCLGPTHQRACTHLPMTSTLCHNEN